MSKRESKSGQKCLAAEQIGVIYARYSSHNQKEESIEQQIAECSEFAAKNGIRIVGIYADKAVSGRSDRRPNFQRMMRDAEKRHFQVVVAYKSNRIARNMLNALQYEARLDLFGIKTLYAKEEFGNTAAGRFALRTMMNVNQFYSENMGEDIKRGMVDNANECKVNGMLPLGYVKSKEGKYAVAPDEAAVVREIFDSFLKDVPVAEIARSLNQRGIRTKLGREWNKNSFHIMLKNDNYIGVYRHSGVVVEDGIPPILEREVFAAVQEKLANKKKAAGRRSANGEYLLTGKLFCGYCGSYMIGVSGTGENGTVHNYYQCQKRHAENRCEKKNVRRDFIEKLIARLTQDYILQDETIEWIADSTMSFQAVARRQSGITQLERDLADNRKIAKNIMAAIEQGIITETTKARLLEVEGTIRDLERSLSIAKAASQPIERERVVFSLEQMREGNVGSKEHQKKLIDTFVKAVTLWDDRIQIDYYHTPGKHKFSYSLEELTSKAENESNAADVRAESLQVHQNNIIRTFCRLVMGSDLLFLLRKLKTDSFVSILDTMLAEQPSAQGVLRVYLKTPNAPGQRAFLRCAASFFLEIRQYSCEKMSCATQKSLAAGHIMSFQIHPSIRRYVLPLLTSWRQKKPPESVALQWIQAVRFHDSSLSDTYGHRSRFRHYVLFPPVPFG